MLVYVRYHEIALKGRNRPFFVGKLVDNLRHATADLPRVTVQAVSSRVALSAPDDLAWETLRERIASVFGVANYSRVVETPPDLEAVKAVAIEAMAARTPSSFRVTTRRAWKPFPMDSVEIEREVGGAIHAATGTPVNLDAPSATVFIEVLKDRMLVSFERIRGAGGFPLGRRAGCSRFSRGASTLQWPRRVSCAADAPCTSSTSTRFRSRIAP